MPGSNERDPYAPCPCGSGRKYKFCCRDRDRAEDRRLKQELLSPEGIMVMDVEESKRLSDEGLAAMASDDFKGAAALFEKSIRCCALNPVAHNNLAICRFEARDFRGAIGIAKRVVETIDPKNDFSLGLLVHFYLLLGRDKEAAAAADRMAGIEAQDATHMIKQCEALARLQRHEQVLSVAREGLGRFGGEEARIFAFFAGAALANMSDFDGAARLLEKARGSRELDPLTSRYLDLLKKRKSPATLYCAWPYLGPNQWIDMRWIEDLARRRPAKEEMAERAPFLAGIRHFVDAFLVFEDDAGPLKGRGPGFADMVVELLKLAATPGAAAVLRDIATGMYGDEKLRMKAAAALKEAGLLGEDEQMEVFVGGKWRKVTVVGREIGGEYDLPEEAFGLYRDAVEASRRGKLRKAVKLGRLLVERFPQCKQGYHNLAKALLDRGGGKNREEARRLLEKALDLDPSYVFSRIGLANIFFAEGRLEEAQEALEAVDTADLRLAEEWAYYNVSRLRLVEARFAERLEALTELEEPAGPGEIEELDKLASEMSDLMESIEKMREAGAPCELPPLSNAIDKVRRALADGAADRNRALRSRIADRGAAAREALAGYTARELRLIGQRIGIPSPAARRKEKLLDEITQELSDADTVGRLVEGLDREETAVCAALIEAGGSMDLVSFSRRFEYREDENFILPSTAAGRLRAAGIVVEGTLGGAQSIFIPGPLAALVGDALAATTKAPAGRSTSAPARRNEE